MNSEELEVSLRTEFENYLKNVFADMRQEISQLQSKIEAELEDHKTRLNESFKEALNRAESGADFDAGFKESVVEHLRLARDEGSRVAADAFAAAEDLKNSEEQSKTPSAGIKELNAAINDISSKDSQGEILKTLVHHASQFAARGAFFVVKKDHFVAWRTFDQNGDSEETVREVFLPISADSILSESVRSLATVESNSETYADDAAVLEKLGFGSPDKMYAIPLVARGRGVAVLYADYGEEGGEVNVEALETMVHVAGLTVEILASSHGTAPKRKLVSEEQAAAPSAAENVSPQHESAPSYQYSTTENSADQSPVTAAENETTGSEYTPSYSPSNSFSYSQNNSGDADQNQDYSTRNYTSEDFSTVPNYETETPQKSSEAENYSVDYSNETAYSDQSKTDELPSNEYTNNFNQTGENYPTYEDSAWNQPAENAAPIQNDESNYSFANEAKQSNYESTNENSVVNNSWNQPAEDSTPMISAQEYAQNYVKDADAPTNDFTFTPTVETEAPSSYQNSQPTNEYQYEKPQSSAESFSSPTETYAPVQTESYHPVNNFESANAKPTENFAEPAATPVAPTASAPVKSRFSDRNVDLPIEVSEDERRLHNDARRFARLLVSEIKLYNEQKVKEGREANDLYERLREAIDRSREMYDKRVQSPVAAKFDYFHYELVNTLAEGNSDKLGESYPGASV